MTQLEDCYFCGAVGATLESYPVIPPETYPPEHAQRTVVLCPTCRKKLGRVLNPVVEYLDSPTAEEEHRGKDEIGEAGDDDTGAEVLERQADDGAHEHGLADTGKHVEDEQQERIGREGNEPIGDEQEERTGGEGTEPIGDEQEERIGGEGTEPIGDEQEERTGGEGTEPIGDEQQERIRGEGTEPIGDEQQERAGEDKPRLGSDTDNRTRPANLPEGTQKIVRLLRNREFPVERGAVVTVAANAYEITREEANLSIDALVEHGWLGERDGELQRPE